MTSDVFIGAQDEYDALLMLLGSAKGAGSIPRSYKAALEAIDV